jgi:putative DNA methylase
LVKELCFLLFSVADAKKWAKDAIAFNNIATSWSDLMDASRSGAESLSAEPTLDFATDDEES